MTVPNSWDDDLAISLEEKLDGWLNNLIMLIIIWLLINLTVGWFFKIIIIMHINPHAWLYSYIYFTKIYTVKYSFIHNYRICDYDKFFVLFHKMYYSGASIKRLYGICLYRYLRTKSCMRQYIWMTANGKCKM